MDGQDVCLCASLGSQQPGTAAASPPCMHAALPLARRWVEAAGGRVAAAEGVEVSPLVSYAGEGLEPLVAGKQLDASFDPLLQAGDRPLQGAQGRGCAWLGCRPGIRAAMRPAACEASTRPAACLLKPPDLRTPASNAQGFLQLAPKSAVGKLVAGAAAEYSSPRPEPKGASTKGAAGAGATIVASSASFRAQ